RNRNTCSHRDWGSDVCSSDLSSGIEQWRKTMRVSLALSLLLGLTALTSTQATEQRHRRDRVVVRPSFTAGFPSQGYRPGGPSPRSEERRVGTRGEEQAGRLDR